MRALRALLFVAALAAPQAARAELEDEVKAAYLFRFLSYVEWPDPAREAGRAPFVIGVMGSDEVFTALREIVRGREAKGRPVEVRRLQEGETPTGVHLLFVGKRATELLRTVARQPGVAVVAEVEGALDRGATVNLLRKGNNVRFEVAPAQAERNGIRISSRMLAVAQHVKPGAP